MNNSYSESLQSDQKQAETGGDLILDEENHIESDQHLYSFWPKVTPLPVQHWTTGIQI